jgi:uncharacterized membrane protein required for colicin V production
MYLDAAALGVPAVLGLLGAWYGFGRFLVSGPIRWLVAVLGASIAALLAALYLVINRELADLLYLSGTAATTAISAVAFLIVLAPLNMFMSNLRERVIVWTGDRRTGSAGRFFGGLLGVLCGLLLVAIPFLLYDATRSDRSDDPPWMRESVALPYFRSAAEAASGAVSSFVRFAGSRPRWQR